MSTTIRHPRGRRRRRRAVPGALPAALLAALLAACAGGPQRVVPDSIRFPPPGDLQLVEARQAPERHRGARVRWGGTVIEVRDEPPGAARIVVLERRLDAAGRPLPGSASDGRFVIRAAPEVHPARYRRGNEVTVAGTLAGVTEGRVGNETLRLPVVRVDAFVDWPPRFEDLYGPHYRGYPYWPYGPYGPYDHDPWYGPRWRLGVGLGHTF